MLARIYRFTRIAHFGEVAVMLAIAHVRFEKLDARFGGGQSCIFFDAFSRQGTEEPNLAALQREELFACRRESAASKGFEITAVHGVNTSGEVEVDDTGFKKLSAMLCLFQQLIASGRIVGSPKKARAADDGENHGDPLRALHW